MLLLYGMSYAVDPWGEPQILTGSMAISAQLSINGTSAETGDVVAAFVTVEGVPQLRGKQAVQIIGGVSGCVLQVYTEANGEAINFQVWDESTQQVIDVTQTLDTEVNGSIGTYPANMYQINAGAQMITDPWSAPVVLTGSMTVMAQVFINTIPAASGDILAAFVTVNGTEQLRGKVPIQIFQGISGCILQVYTESGGEQIVLKVWDYSAQAIIPVIQTLASGVNGDVGSYPDNLYQVLAGSVVNVVATPSFSPVPGTYTTAQSVAISCSTSGAHIRYTTNGTTPTETSTLYSQPIIMPLNSTTHLKAKAFLAGWTPSDAFLGTYTITGAVATPTFSPNPGVYQSARLVTISCATYGAQIRYTTDGTDPTEGSTQYSTPINMPLNSTTTLKARAFKSGWDPSPIASANYTITGTVATPVMDPPAGIYQAPTSVTITCATEGAQIRYTTNGTEPSINSPLYNMPISVNASATIKARGFLANWTVSATATAVYTITGTLPMPVFTPEPGEYENAVDVSLSCNMNDAEIRYTLDGTEPTQSSALYVSPIHLSQSTNIRAKGFKTSWAPSETAIGQYDISVANPEDPATPIVTGITDIYPNPFSGLVTFKFGIKEANQAYNLTIYNIKGECVHRLTGYGQGTHEISWNGCSSSGTKLSSGIYLISFSSGSTSQTRKVIIK